MLAIAYGICGLKATLFFYDNGKTDRTQNFRFKKKAGIDAGRSGGGRRNRPVIPVGD